jgi:hypothetical protein
MPVNGFNVGNDYTLSYYDGSSGALVNLGDVQDVKIHALKHDVKSMPYNSPPRYGYVPDGYKIEFSITRSGPDLENFMVAAEKSFNQGAVQKPGVLNQTTINPDGSISRYQYINMVIFLTDHGNIQRDAVVKIMLDGYASTKTQIA